MDWLTWAGFGLALLAVASYLVLLFVIHDFTYSTWLYDGVVALGVISAGVGSMAGGSATATISAMAIGLAWFVLTRRELAIKGSNRLELRPGDRLPGFRLLTTDRREVTDQDLVANAPALLVLYRGWWCPSHKAQLDEILAAHERLARAGLSVYAGSVDSPEESQPVQDRVGDKITILCGVPNSLLDDIGVRDERGAPWYDRLIFGAKNQAISMPAAIVVDERGSIVYARRSTRVDQRPAPDHILSGLNRT
ncbi:MAG: redoxin domain-containing protein [Acidimicrobiia bacterium]